MKTTARARFFGGAMLTRPVMVDPDGTVYVWDEIARHYTLCHNLSRAAQRRIVRAAKRAQPAS